MCDLCSGIKLSSLTITQCTARRSWRGGVATAVVAVRGGGGVKV